MSPNPDPIFRFLLNDQTVSATAPAGMLVLDYLRQRQGKTGTKEGCREGDCGACTVLLGELVDDRVRYQPVTSCLLPLGEVDGKHLITIEGLQLDQLTPIQQAIVDEGASQCGFCTPGIVVSLTALLLQDEVDFSPRGVERALSGHLCRCTGYRSLRASGERVRRQLDGGPRVAKGRKGAQRGDTRWEPLIAAGHLPGWLTEASTRLAALRDGGRETEVENGTAAGTAAGKPWRIAGGTDLYVQRGDELARSPVNLLDSYPEMKGIHRVKGHLRMGALTTFEEVMHHPKVRELIPGMAEYMHWVASWQIRNRATLGGNLINASPIGDMNILLLAMGAELAIRRGEDCRDQPLTTFYTGYKQFEMDDDEILTEVLLPVRDRSTRVHFEKVAKRQTLDIASVNSAMRIRLQDGLIAEVGIAAGGVAPIPLFLKDTSKGLIGRAIERSTVDDACRMAQGEISPISDVRGQADYKRLALHHQLIAHFCHLFPDDFAVGEFL